MRSQKSSYPVRKSEIPWRELENGDLMLLSLETGDYFILNPSAAYVWSLLNGTASMTEIAAALEEQFSDSAVKVGARLEAFIAELEEKKLAQLSSEPVSQSSIELEYKLAELESYTITPRGNLKIMNQFD